MAPDVADVVRGLQPYNRPDPTSDALVSVHELDTIDKHRVPVTIGLPRLRSSFMPTVQFGTDDEVDPTTLLADVVLWRGALEPGVPLVEQRSRWRISKVSGVGNLSAVV